MNLTIIHEPPFEPVTLLDVYRVLRVDPTGSPAEHPLDDDFTRNIVTARRQVEAYTRRSLIRQTLRLSCAGFPTTCQGSYLASRTSNIPTRVHLLRPPLQYVQRVEYFDADNALQLVDSASYYTTDDKLPELRFVSSFVAPATYDRPDALRVTYVAGYEGEGSPPSNQAEFAEHVPSEIKEAILVGVQMLQTSVSPADFDLLKKMQASLLSTVRVLLEP